MKQVKPHKRKPESSRASQLVVDCRSALQRCSEDQSHLQELLSDFNAERKKLIARFDSQLPGWNDVASPDNLRFAAESTLRICIKSLSLVIAQQKLMNDLVEPKRFIYHALGALNQIATEISFVMLNAERLAKQPTGVMASAQNTLMFETASHLLQVDTFCYFLRRMKEFCPISAELIADWVGEIHSIRSVGQMIRRTTMETSSLLILLSSLPGSLFKSGCSANDRSTISSLLLKLREWQTFDSVQTLGRWDWFDEGAGQLCVDRLLRAGILHGLPVGEMKSASYSSAGIGYILEMPNAHQLDVGGDTREHYDRLNAVEVANIDGDSNNRKIRTDTFRNSAAASVGEIDEIEQRRLIRLATNSTETQERGCHNSETEGPHFHSRIRDAWVEHFRSFTDDESVLQGIALAIHPWPDADLPAETYFEIAGELFPANNLSHFNILETCSDRLYRIAEVFEYQHLASLGRQYSEAAARLAIVAPLFRPTMSPREWLNAVVSSATGLGVPDARAVTIDDASKSTLPDRLSETLDHIAGVTAANTSTDLGQIGHGEPTGVTVEDLASRLGVTLPIKAFDAYLAQLNSRDRGVLMRRKLTMQSRQTLDDAGSVWGVTRERIRQVEAKAFENIDRLFRTRFQSLGKPILQQARNNILPTNELHDLATYVCRASLWPDAAAAFMLHSLGPWVARSSWSVHASLVARLDSLPSKFAGVADTRGLIAIEALDEACAGLFRNSNEREEYLRGCVGLGFVCGMWALKNTNRSRIVAALTHIGKPATKEEVAVLANITLDQAATTLAATEGIVRADRYRWGFSEWIDDEYDGIAGEIIQRIDAFGGVVRADLLISEIPELFGVSENSVRAYLASDAFVVEEGLVRRGDAEEFTPSDIRKAKDAVLIDGMWGQRLRLHQRFFAGYSLGISLDIAYANGIRPDDALKVPIVNSKYEASIIWRLHTLNRLVDVGRVAEFLRSSDFQSDDEVVVIATRQFVDIRRATAIPIQLLGKKRTDDPMQPQLNDPLLDMLGDVP